jgi:hypothetical protein
MFFVLNKYAKIIGTCVNYFIYNNTDNTIYIRDNLIAFKHSAKQINKMSIIICFYLQLKLLTKACLPSKLYHFYYYFFLCVSIEYFSMINHQYVTNIPKFK